VGGVSTALLREDTEEDLTCVRIFEGGVLGGCELVDASGCLGGRVEGLGASFLVPPKKDFRLCCLRDSVDAFGFGAILEESSEFQSERRESLETDRVQWDQFP